MEQHNMKNDLSYNRLKQSEGILRLIGESLLYCGLLRAFEPFCIK